jgi:peptidoglycan/LPS O-acetylase OafA/YrhL
MVSKQNRACYIQSASRLVPKASKTHEEMSMQYRPEIDGLRALAVIPVILFHAGFQEVSGGFIGVDIFFVISGYLITSIITSDLQADTFTLAGFYERRIRRILPALFLVMLVCLPCAWILMIPGEMKPFSESVLSVTAFVSNIFFWRTSRYFGGAAELKPLLHTWSLAVEEQFYLIFPVFFIFLWKHLRQRIWITFSAVAVVSFMAAEWGSLNQPFATFYLLPTRSFELIVGAIVALKLSSNGIALREPARWTLVKNQMASVAGIVVIGYAILFFDRRMPYPSAYTLLPVVGTSLVILFATPANLTGKLLSTRLFVGTGLISYSAYLWHQPVFSFARMSGGDSITNLVLMFLCLLTFFLAFLTWKYIERPFRDLEYYNRSTLFKFVGTACLCLITFGVFGSYSNGFLFRFNGSDRYLASISNFETGKYVRTKFLERMNKDFNPGDMRRRVLIIGDSYAQDLVNSIFEIGADEHWQISTKYVSNGCGNLFLPREEFTQMVGSYMKQQCAKEASSFGFGELYGDQKLRRLMLDADEIWYASKWLAWEAKLISTSVQNTVRHSANSVKVFGRKNLGSVNIRYFLSKNIDERISIRSSVDPETIEVNILMRERLGFPIFVDIQKLICSDQLLTCSPFTHKGEVLSHDGGHLTSFGAKYLGARLLASGVF